MTNVCQSLQELPGRMPVMFRRQILREWIYQGNRPSDLAADLNLKIRKPLIVKLRIMQLA